MLNFTFNLKFNFKMLKFTLNIITELIWFKSTLLALALSLLFYIPPFRFSLVLLTFDLLFKFFFNIMHLWLLFFSCCCFVFLGPHPWHMEVPRLGIKSELQLPACTTATAMQDPSCVCNLHHSSWQHQILNPLNEARN